MKTRTLIIAGTLSFLLASLGQLPASLLVKALPANLPLRLQGVGGTLWQGYATQLSWQQISLKNVAWDIRLLPLLKGNLATQFSAQPVAGGTLEGVCSFSLTGKLHCKPLTITDLPATALTPYVQRLMVPPLSGQFQANALDLHWDQHSLPRISGSVEWREAGVQMLPQRYGTYSATLVSGENDSQQINLASAAEAAFTLNGTVSVEADGRYQSQINLKPGSSIDDGTKQFLSNFIVQPQPDGTYRIQEQGQLPPFN